MSNTALDGIHALIVDVGAISALSGDVWARRQAVLAAAAGHQAVQKKMSPAMSVSGVGNGSQLAEWQVTVPVAIMSCDADGHEEEVLLSGFTSPTISGSELPGLWGLDSMESNRVLLDTFSPTPMAYMVGPGGYEIKLSPGSRRLPLMRAPSRHLLLPTSAFDKIKKEKGPDGLQLRPTEVALSLPVVATSSSSSSAL